MAKKADDIIKWGKIKPFFDKSYNFNSIDIETIDNEMFLIGFSNDNEYKYYETNFFENFNKLLIETVQQKRDILTWSRYDNTHLLKLILMNTIYKNHYQDIIEKIGKVSPILEYKYKGFNIKLVNIIRDSMIFEISADVGKRNVTIYNLKNLFTTDLLTTANNYKIEYSKLGQEYHIIDKKRYDNDPEYKKMVLLSNEYDCKVLPKIAYQLLQAFKQLTGRIPKSIFSNGSLARSYLLARVGVNGSKKLQFKSMFSDIEKEKPSIFKSLLDYSMKSYHGGKIDAFAIGKIGNAWTVDISSAYPYALSILPEIDNSNVYYGYKTSELDQYFYAFINCNIYDIPDNFYHPVVIESPLSNANISPSGTIKNIVITKIEYDFLIENNIKVKVNNWIALKHLDNYPYQEMISTMFDIRVEAIIAGNKTLDNLLKTIINSLYGITFELTNQYEILDDEIKKVGLRAGDYFNPIIASYITSITRTRLSKADNIITKNGGKVVLNMTDSIFYISDNEIDLGDMQSDSKVIGLFERADKIENLTILGAGRYEYRLVDKNKYVVKTRGFEAKIKDDLFYDKFDLNNQITIEHKNFITAFKSGTSKFSLNELGYLIDDKYNINPKNIGGKRIIKDINCDLNNGYTDTLPIYLDEKSPL